MQEVTRKSDRYWPARACSARSACGALLTLAAALIFVAVSYYRLRNNKPFRLASKSPELSKEGRRVEGYEQRLMRTAVVYVGASGRDITFTDDHHELEQVNLAVSSGGDKPDQILANKAILRSEDRGYTFVET